MINVIVGLVLPYVAIGLVLYLPLKRSGRPTGGLDKNKQPSHNTTTSTNNVGPS